VKIKLDKSGHPIPNGKGKRWWTKLPLAERQLHTDWRFKAGHRNADVMAALGLSVGTVSGIKRIWREREEKSPGSDMAPPSAPPPPEPEQPVPEVPETKETVVPEQLPTRSDPGKPKSLKLATSEATQCGYRDPTDRMRCAREFTDAQTRRCDFHPLKGAP